MARVLGTPPTALRLSCASSWRRFCSGARKYVPSWHPMARSGLGDVAALPGERSSARRRDRNRAVLAKGAAATVARTRVLPGPHDVLTALVPGFTHHRRVLRACLHEKRWHSVPSSSGFLASSCSRPLDFARAPPVRVARSRHSNLPVLAGPRSAPWQCRARYPDAPKTHISSALSFQQVLVIANTTPRRPPARSAQRRLQSRQPSRTLSSA